jgi:hypothetical protein
VRDLNVAIDRYRKAFHLPVPQLQDDTKMQMHLAAFIGTPVVLASPLRASSPLAARIQKFGEAPYAFVLDQANHTFSGYIGESSSWFGTEIFWIDTLGSDHPWIGVRSPKR